VRAAIIVMPLLGVTWVVGIFAINENTEVFAWIFTILNSLQVLGSLPTQYIVNIIIGCVHLDPVRDQK